MPAITTAISAAALWMASHATAALLIRLALTIGLTANIGGRRIIRVSDVGKP